jgi:hypothetical protein
MEIFFAYTCLGHGQGRLEKIEVPYTGATAIAMHLILVYLKNLAEGEEYGFGHLIRQVFKHPAIFAVGPIQGILKSFTAFLVAHRGNDQDFSISGYIQRRVGVDV